jgi:hypothetical protein
MDLARLRMQHARRCRKTARPSLGCFAIGGGSAVARSSCSRWRPASRRATCRFSRAAALEIPLRERNPLLAAAGFAPGYRESDLGAPELAMLRRVLDFLLEQHAPFPAVLLDRHWNLLGMNTATPRVLGRFASAGGPWLQQPINLLRLTLHPEALQPFIVNFDEVATELLTGLHRKAASDGADATRDALLAELRALPGIPEAGVLPDLSLSPRPVMPLHLKRDDLELRLFTVVTQIASPQDVGVEGLRIESFMPADPESEAVIRRLASEARSEAKSSEPSEVG